MSSSDREDLGETRAEELYDSYVEAALAGRAVEPEEFLAERGFPEGEVVEDLVDRLRSIQELAGSGFQTRRKAEGGLPYEQLGDYRLVEKIGSGAMGVVYLAEQGSLARLVALKVIREELAGTAGAEQRFEREARALARIQHPGIVRLLGFGREEGVRYLAMELVPGQSLAELIHDGLRLEPVQVAQWGLELSRALARVHAAGLLHRDVKPSNVRIHEDGHSVLVDFGLSRSADLASVSHSGGFAGSLAYASPEQVRASGDIEVTTDIYSLAATLYHALTGRPPIEADGIEALLQNILREQPTPLRSLRGDVPADLATVIHHALAKDPARRYPSSLDFAADLERVLALKPIRAKSPGPAYQFSLWMRRNPAAAGAGLVAMLSLLGVLVLLILQARWRQEGRLDDARTALLGAEAEVATYRASRVRMSQKGEELRELTINLEHSYLDDDSRQRHAELIDEVEAARRQRAGTAFRVGDLLATAQRLEPDLEEAARAVHAEFLVERWRDALLLGDAAEMRQFELELESIDPSGELRTGLFPKQPIGYQAVSGDTDVYLFRMGEWEQDAETGIARSGVPRDVAMPWGPEGALGWRVEPDGAPIDPQAWYLRPASQQADEHNDSWCSTDLLLELDGWPIEGGPIVAVDRGPLMRGDRLISVEDVSVRDSHAVGLAARDEPEPLVLLLREGETLELLAPELLATELLSVREWAERFGGRGVRLRDGARQALDVPAGRSWRTTAMALVFDSRNRLDVPHGQLSLERGNYVAVAIRNGCAPQFVGFFPDGLNPIQLLELNPRPLGFAPGGFIHAGHANSNLFGETWIHEHEVTTGEWREFLDDPHVRRRQEADWAAGGRALLPRGGGRFERDVYWRRREDDSWDAPGWSWDWPVIGIAPEDAEAFTEWRSNGISRGEIWIGDYGSHVLGSYTHTERPYAWGRYYDPQAANTCYSRPAAGLEPVMNNPLDQNPYGVFDLSGSTSELMQGWFDEANGYRLAIGGNWGEPRAEQNFIDAFQGFRPDQASGVSGVRLYWKPPVEESL